MIGLVGAIQTDEERLYFIAAQKSKESSRIVCANELD